MEKLNNKTNNNTADFLELKNEVPFLNTKNDNIKKQKPLPYKPALSHYNNRKQAAVSRLLDIDREYCQVHPTLLLRFNDCRQCDVCNTPVYTYGTVQFTEYHRTGEVKRQVKIQVVCEKCMNIHGIVNVTVTKLGRLLVMHKGLVEEKFDEVFKRSTCVFCNKTCDCGMVRMRYHGLPIDLKLCEKHLAMCNYDPKWSEEIKEHELMQKEMDELATQMGLETFKLEDAVAAFNKMQKGDF